jgi:hypothetical protein
MIIKATVAGENQRKTYPSATSSATNLTWTDPGANRGLRSERAATNRLSLGVIVFNGQCMYKPPAFLLIMHFGHEVY